MRGFYRAMMCFLCNNNYLWCAVEKVQKLVDYQRRFYTCSGLFFVQEIRSCTIHFSVTFSAR